MPANNNSTDFAETLRLFTEISRLPANQRRERVEGIQNDSVRAAVSKKLAKRDQLTSFRSLQDGFKYTILEEIGRGGVGVVYKAQQKGLNRLVALKVFQRTSFQSPDNARPLLKAAESAANLDHRGILSVLESGIHNGKLYIATEFVNGGSLAAKLTKQPMSPAEAATMMNSIADALAHAHGRGIIHRDLKPENVLLNSEGNPKVADFDLAIRAESEEQPDELARDGTPSYMSPEQAKGDRVGTETDVYSLGAVLYAMLTGRPPFEGASVAETLEDVIRREPVPPRTLNPRIPRDLETICLKCLRKLPEQRYNNAADLAADVCRYVSGEPITARPVSRLERLWKWAKRNRTIAALCCLLAFAIVGGFIGISVEAWRTHLARQRSDANLATGLEVLDFVNREIVSTDLANAPQMEPVRRMILERNLTFYEGLLAENEPTSRVLQGGTIYLSVGDIRHALGQLDAAEEAYRAAVNLYQTKAIFEHGSELSRQAFLRSWNSVANLQNDRGQFHEWNKTLDRMEQFLETYPPPLRDTDEYIEAFAALRSSQARHRLKTDQFEEAESLCRGSLAARKTLADRSPRRADYLDQLASCWFNLGNVLKRTETADDVQKAYVSGLQLHEEIAEAFPDDAGARGKLATAYRTLALFHKQTKRPELAAEYYQKAHDTFNLLVSDYPGIPSYRHELAETLNGVSAMINATDAVPLLEKAVAQQRVACDLAPKNVIYQQKLRNHLNQLAFAYGDAGDYRNAASTILDFLSIADRAADKVFGSYLLVQCSLLASDDEGLTESERGRLGEEYRAAARDQLQEAKDAGQLSHKVLQIPLFVAVRASSDFMALANEVLDK